MLGGDTLKHKVDGRLSLSVAMLCAVFIVLVFACFLLVTVWLSVQQHTLRFERKISEVSVAAVRMFHATNKFNNVTGLGSGTVMPEHSELHEDLMASIRDFTEKSQRVRLLFRKSKARPDWYDTTGYLTWYTGATTIPDEIRDIWDGNASGQTVADMLSELKSTCLYLCDAPDATIEDRQRAIVRMNDLAVNHLQPQLGQLLTATVHWQAENIRATRRAVAIAFVMLVVAVLVIWRGLIARLLRRIEAAKRQLARQNSELECRVLERTESLSAALEIANDAAKSRSAFLANMSHEIRTPMNGVLGMAALLGATKLDEKQRLHVETITKSGTVLLRIIDDVLDMSGLAAGKLRITRSEANVAEIVQDVVTLLAPMAKAKGLPLDVELLNSARTLVLVDPQRLSQVLNNLIGNALKFTDMGGVNVTLDGVIKAGVLMTSITIKDTGIGIPENQLDRIFGEFERVRSGNVISGAGLGLAISRSLVLEMNGQIHVSSFEGHGACFTVKLPLDLAQKPAAKTAQGFAAG